MNYFPVLVTLLAGLSTVLGATLVSKKRNTALEALALSFATGIMISIAIFELIPASYEVLNQKTIIYILIGIATSIVLDVVLPHHHDNEDEHEEVHAGHYMEECECTHKDSVSKGMIIALVLHNVLEGLATGITTVSDARMGISIALGIAFHNIPIGATLALSLLSAGKTKKQAIIIAALIGLSQPLGAIFGLFFYSFTSNPVVLSSCNAIVSGILLYISYNELWPAAKKNGKIASNLLSVSLGVVFILIAETL